MFSSIHTSYKKHTKAASIVFGLIVILFVTFLSGVNPLTMIGDQGATMDYGTLNGRSIDSKEYQAIFDRWKPSYLLSSPANRLDQNDRSCVNSAIVHAAQLEKIDADIKAKKFTPKSLNLSRKEDVERAAKIIDDQFRNALIQGMYSGRIPQQVAMSLIGSKLDARIKMIREEMLIPGPTIDAAIQDLVLIADYQEFLTAGVKENPAVEQESARLATRLYDVRSLQITTAGEAEKILKAEYQKQGIKQPFAECQDRLLLNLYKGEAEKQFALLLKSRFTVSEALEVLEVKFSAKSQEAAIKLDDAELNKLYEDKKAQFKRQQFKGCIVSRAVGTDNADKVALELAGLFVAAKTGSIKADTEKGVNVRKFDDWQDVGNPDGAIGSFLAKATNGDCSGVIDLSPGQKGFIFVKEIRAEVPHAEALVMIRKVETERRSARLANQVARKFVDEIKLSTALPADKFLDEARKAAVKAGAMLEQHPAVERTQINPAWTRLSNEAPVSAASSNQDGTDINVGILVKIVPEHPLKFGENGSDLTLCRELNETEGAKNAEAESAKLKSEIDKLETKALSSRLEALKFGKVQKATEASLAADLSSREHQKGDLIVTPGAKGSELLWIASANDADAKVIADKATELAKAKASQERSKILSAEHDKLMKNIKFGTDK